MPVPQLNGSDRRTKAKEVWRHATAVSFDVDSTLIQEEGIDKLAAYCGAGAQVAEWTKKAMGGSVTFHEALSTRLGLIQPSLQQLTDFIQHRTPEEVLTPGVKTLVALLQSQGVAVYLVSGGFRQLIEPIAKYLGIPKDNVFANRLLFNEEGQYAGFDETEPTCRSGGKPKVVHQIKQKHNVVVMIGDGATDMEASPPADTFIGFGGNVVREKVKDGAPWFVYSFQELIDELRPLENGQLSNGEHAENGQLSNGEHAENGQLSNGEHAEQIEGYTNGKIVHHESNGIHCNGINGFACSSFADGKELKAGIHSHESEALVD